MPDIRLAAGEEHEEVKKRLAKYMQTEYSYTITHMADAAPKYTEPPKIGRHIPDILAEKKVGDKTQKAIGEAKSCTGLDDEETKEQIEDYDYKKSKHEFFLGVPESCLDKATELMSELEYSTDKKNHLVHFDLT